MADFKYIDECIKLLLLADIVAISALPLSFPMAYLHGKLHEGGLKDGKSGIGMMWTFASKMDLRDIYFDGIHDEKIMEKYGLSKYFQH